MSSPPSKRRSDPSGSTEKPTVAPDAPNPLAAVFETPEYLVGVIYPATLLIAGTFSLLSPSPAASSSYFSLKTNFFNVVFVKYGWAWTTLAFALHLRRVRASRSKAVIRWGLATVWWILVTQWCFGR